MFKKEDAKCAHRLLMLDWNNEEADYYKCALCGAGVKYLTIVKSKSA